MLKYLKEEPQVKLSINAIQQLNQSYDYYLQNYEKSFVLVGSVKRVENNKSKKTVYIIESFVVPSQSYNALSVDYVPYESKSDLLSNNSTISFNNACVAYPINKHSTTNNSDVLRKIDPSLNEFIEIYFKKDKCSINLRTGDFMHEDIPWSVFIEDSSQTNIELELKSKIKSSIYNSNDIYGYGYSSYGSDYRYGVSRCSGYNYTGISPKSTRPNKKGELTQEIGKILPEDLVTNLEKSKKDISNFNFNGFITILQSNLFDILDWSVYHLKKYFNESIFHNDNYVFAKGTLPVCLVAHLDTVYKTPPTTILKSLDGNIMSSLEGIGGDDRCGIYTILCILETLYQENSKGEYPSILFTVDEEIGCIGAKEAAKEIKNDSSAFNFLIELDRRGSNDMVFYTTNNSEFETFIGKFGFKKANGSSSDIKYLEQEWNVAASNLSIGYFNEHQKQSEYINLKYMIKTAIKVISIVKESKNTNVFHRISTKTVKVKSKIISDTVLNSKVVSNSEYDKHVGLMEHFSSYPM